MIGVVCVGGRPTQIELRLSLVRIMISCRIKWTADLTLARIRLEQWSSERCNLRHDSERLHRARTPAQRETNQPNRRRAGAVQRLRAGIIKANRRPTKHPPTRLPRTPATPSESPKPADAAKRAELQDPRRPCPTRQATRPRRHAVTRVSSIEQPPSLK